jgi:hypothetical protein
MFIIVEQLYGTWGRRERKGNDRLSTISKYIASVQVADTTIYIESC